MTESSQFITFQEFADLERIVLIGFSATGKTSIALDLAGKLGWSSVDTDTVIEELAGKTIREIFFDDGEKRFRELERQACEIAAQTSKAVVATGGGAWVDPRNRIALSEQGWIVCLEARIDTILARHIEGETDDRPMIAGADPGSDAPALKVIRQPYYALADATIHTDGFTLHDVSHEIIRQMEHRLLRTLKSKSRIRIMSAEPSDPFRLNVTKIDALLEEDLACLVKVENSQSIRYPVYCGWNILVKFPKILQDLKITGRLFQIYDKEIKELYADPLAIKLREDGWIVEQYKVTAGEKNKNLEQLSALYDWMSSRKAERQETVLAMGGGVTTDLAGTLAATYLRGLPLMHIPTTLLGMSDAAIGGKVAIDLPVGKNLVGAFYQPKAVVADVSTLATLPMRELSAGFAEVIKHAFIRNSAMLNELRILAKSQPIITTKTTEEGRHRITDLISRNMALKADIISTDERESSIRMLLNYGHTIGHAIEQASGYGQYLHGEAVAIGMVGAAMIAERMGMIDATLTAEHKDLLTMYSLPIYISRENDITVDDILHAILSDKKITDGQQRWVLLKQAGEPVIRNDVPTGLIEEVVEALVH